MNPAKGANQEKPLPLQAGAPAAPPVVIQDGSTFDRSTDQLQRLAALPSIVAILASTLLLVVLATPANPAKQIARYERNATLAVSTGDYQTARICYEKLLQQHPGNPRYQDGLQLCLQRLSESN